MDWEQSALIKELKQGKEFTMQLRTLNLSASKQDGMLLLEKITSSYGKALSMLGMNANFAGKDNPTLESPCSIAISSPKSEISKDSKADDLHQNAYKKRKRLPSRTERVKVLSNTRLEVALDDGHSWRKYGQKGILGSKFPRGYFRCTHRFSQGCMATKLVQRSDNDPSFIEVTYKGQHTCVQASRRSTASPLAKTTEIKENKTPNQQQKVQENPSNSEEILLNFEAEGLKVEKENLNKREDIFPCFSLSNSFKWTENVENYNSFMDSIMENISPPTFVSPETSDSNYIPSVSPSHMNSFAESDLTEVISCQTSVTNSPIGNLDFSLDGFDSLPTDDNSELFSLFFSTTPSDL